MVEINLKRRFPLLHENECKSIFSNSAFVGHWEDHSFIKPIYKYLPNFEHLNKNEIDNHIFKDLEPGKYLVGLSIISEYCFISLFTNDILKGLGLVLKEANPIKGIGYNKGEIEKPFIVLEFEHIIFSIQSEYLSVEF